MRRGALLGTALLLLAGDYAFLACGTSESTPGATPIEGGDSGGNNVGPGVMPDGGAPPQAVGDPCRGVALPEDQHFVPPGMCARVVARVPSARQLSFAPNGDLFVQAQNGVVSRLRDVDGDGFFQPNEVVRYGTTGGNGNNCHIDVEGGHLYCGSSAGVARFPYSPDAEDGGDPETVITGQPTGGHGIHTVHVYNGYIYVNSGSAGNATHSNGMAPDYDTNRSVLKRWPLSAFTGTALAWNTGEVVTVGLRNMNGFVRNASGRMYGVINGLDNQAYPGATSEVTNDNPGEQVVPIAMGNKFGYPYCFTAQRVNTAAGVVAPGTQLRNIGFNVHDDTWCAANSMQPSTFVQAHSAPLDLAFFDAHPQGALPEKYRGGAFVALHGSWNRSPATGYKVVWIPFDASGKAPMPTSTATTTTFPYETVFGGGSVAGGAEDGPWSWSAAPYMDQVRPAGVAVHPIDGALYVATDDGGMIYRIGLKK